MCTAPQRTPLLKDCQTPLLRVERPVITRRLPLLPLPLPLLLLLPLPPPAARAPWPQASGYDARSACAPPATPAAAPASALHLQRHLLVLNLGVCCQQNTSNSVATLTTSKPATMSVTIQAKRTWG